MDTFYQDSLCVVLGSTILAFVEIVPIVAVEEESSDSSCQSQRVALALALSYTIKTKLQEASRRYKLEILWQGTCPAGATGQQHDKGSSLPTRPTWENPNRLKRGFLVSTDQRIKESKTQQQDYPTMHFPSEDPLELEPICCLVIGYAVDKNKNRDKVAGAPPQRAVILDGTLVRVLPPMSSKNAQQLLETDLFPFYRSFLDELIGELPTPNLPDYLKQEMVCNHDSTTIQQLKLRMSLLLAEPIRIGTTEDALVQLERQQKRQNRMAAAIQSFCRQQQDNKDSPCHQSPLVTKDTQDINTSSSLPAILKDGALLVHSPHHADGKTTLVKYIAKYHLMCDSIHVIQPAALLAKYGSQADAGLETMMHAITMSAAVKGKACICIILDHFNAMMPPGMSAASGEGDAAVPVLHAIASYLKSLVLSLKHRREFSFPSKNILYNVGGKGGFILAVRVCLVAIVTCPDNGWRSARLDLGRNSGIFDAIPIGTYRLPSLDATARVAAFENAFRRERVVLSIDAQQILGSLARAALWARGRQFSLVAKMVLRLASGQGRDRATAEDMEQAFEFYARGKTGGTQMLTRQKAAPKNDSFSSVGGIGDAKKALLDVLALDTFKRGLLEQMGIESPIGVLLYGPPGCGKTLLAKAVALYLGAENKQFGGAFIPLNSSEIVQSAVGESEKLIVNSFVAARENAPSVIFIDEFQALFMERSSSGSSKLSSTLLQCMDDVKQWRKASKSASGVDSSKTVIVLGATNTPWMLDKSFLRPGRFDRIIHVGLPSERDREAILKVHIGRMRIQGGNDAVHAISMHVCQRTEGFSGADLAELCKSAAIRALVEKCSEVKEAHFDEEIQKKPGGSSNSELVRRNADWRP